MQRRISLLLCLLFVVCDLSMFGVSVKVAAEQLAPAETGASLAPLPKSCGGGLPPGASVPACCLFGYVFLDGEAVAGAKVTVTNVRGQAEDWTAAGPDSPLPYFRLSLSEAPLQVAPGETITIRAEYSGRQRSLTWVALAGAQQVDLVLLGSSVVDYRFAYQILGKDPPGMTTYPHDIASDATGNLYVADSGNARIQVFNSSRQFLYEWGSLGEGPGQFSGENQSIAISRTGAVYIVDKRTHRVQQFTTSGTFVRSWGGLGAAVGQLSSPLGIAVDSVGNVFVADTGNHRIQKFSSQGQWLGAWGSLGSSDGQFNAPAGLAIDADDNLYVVEVYNYRVQKFTRDGRFLTKWGTQGNGVGEFMYPTGIALGPGNTVYVADSWNHRVQKFTRNGQWLGFINGQFTSPTNLTIDPSGDLHVADTFNNRIQTFDAAGQLIAIWATSEATPGKFFHPSGLAYDQRKNLYIVDRLNNRIQKFDGEGHYVSQWGAFGSGAGQFRNPHGIVVSDNGLVYVVDTENHRVQRFTDRGVFVSQWGTQGTGPGQFINPTGVAIDQEGNVFVSDTDNNRIQKFSSNGIFLLQWGGLGSGNGQFRRPYGLAIDKSGYIYVVDRDNHRIQKFTSNGSYVAQWGRPGNGNGQFLAPEAIAVERSGSLLVVDTWNHRLQRFTNNGVWLGSWGAEGSSEGKYSFPAGIAINQQSEVSVADGVNNRIQVLRASGYTRPIATLVAVSARSVVQGQPITFYGIGSDSDETPDLAALEWLLNGAPTPFATGPTVTLATASLALGRHTISLRARDTEGELSDLVSTTINVSPASRSGPARWTFLLYLDGDAPNLATYLSRTSPLGALYRLEQAAPHAQVTVAALYDGPLPGGGDSFRYLFRPDGSFSQESLGEVNMGDPQTLVEFVRWGLTQAPADHTYLALADHATALDGIAWDLTSGRNERLTPGEIRSALVAITEGGAYPIDVLHYDGCLMGLLELAYQVRGLARYLVASENLGWSIFAYEQYRALVTPQQTPQGLAEGIAARYAQLVGGAGYPATVAALDLSQVDATARAIDALAGELLRYALASGENRLRLAQLRSQVQKLDSGADFFLQNEDEYLDLDHWAEVVAAGVSDSGVVAQAEAVRSRLRQLVLRNYATSGSLEAVVGVVGAGYDLRNARGVGVYYPPRASVRTYQTYVQGELTFVTDTRWDEYLGAGLAALPFDPRPVEPQPVEPLPLPSGQDLDPTSRHRVFLPLLWR